MSDNDRSTCCAAECQWHAGKWFCGACGGETTPDARKPDHDDDWEDEEESGPTGHGDICYSDADPGL